MGKFCANCGTGLDTEAKFCVKCGKALANQSHNHNIGALSNYNKLGFFGFSERINDPEIIKEIEERDKKGRGCIFIGIPLPLVILLIVSLVSDEVGTKDALVFGGGISFVFLLLYLFSSFLTKAKRTWDGTVIDKKIKNKSRRFRDGDIQHYTEYTVYFRTDSGKKEVSVGCSNGDPDFKVYYDYLNIGDRVRYHPQLAFRYEKYDKSHDRVIPCMLCKTMNKIQNDRCTACKCLLFK
jgi:hypothetical protein